MAIDLTGKDYSPGQIAQSVWDEDSNRIRVDAEVTAVIGELSVDLDAADDSVAIGDGTNLVDVNSDGSLNVKINGVTSISYAEVTNINSNILTTIISETQFTAKKLTSIQVSGGNYAEYFFILNGTDKLKMRTNVTNLNGVIVIDDLQLNIGDVVQVKVTHNRPDVADFNASLFYKS